MNENLNLVEILKDCPKGTKLYSCIHGEVEFCGILEDEARYPILTNTSLSIDEIFTFEGRYHDGYNGECILFPSKDNRDWSTFVAPKVERFHPKMLEPFEKVLVRNNGFKWEPRFFAVFDGNRRNDREITDTGGCWWEHAIPYEGNEELYRTTNEPDEYYRYWED